MAKAMYIGVDSKARKVKKMYVGVDGKARKVKKAYIGVDGKARCFYKTEFQKTGTTTSSMNVIHKPACSIQGYAVLTGGTSTIVAQNTPKMEAISSNLTKTSITTSIASYNLDNTVTVGGTKGMFYTGSSVTFDVISTNLTKSQHKLTQMSTIYGGASGNTHALFRGRSTGNALCVIGVNSNLVETNYVVTTAQMPVGDNQVGASGVSINNSTFIAIGGNYTYQFLLFDNDTLTYTSRITPSFYSTIGSNDQIGGYQMEAHPTRALITNCTRALTQVISGQYYTSNLYAPYIYTFTEAGVESTRISHGMTASNGTAAGDYAKGSNSDGTVLVGGCAFGYGNSPIKTVKFLDRNLALSSLEDYSQAQSQGTGVRIGGTGKIAIAGGFLGGNGDTAYSNLITVYE